MEHVVNVSTGCVNHSHYFVSFLFLEDKDWKDWKDRKRRRKRFTASRKIETKKRGDWDKISVDNYVLFLSLSFSRMKE